MGAAGEWVYASFRGFGAGDGKGDAGGPDVAHRTFGRQEALAYLVLEWCTRQAVESQDVSKLRRVGMDETSRRRRHQ